MGKVRTKYVCQQCGYETARYMGKCPECSTWESFVEEIIASETQPKNSRVILDTLSPTPLNEVKIGQEIRIKTNISEFDPLSDRRLRFRRLP